MHIGLIADPPIVMHSISVVMSNIARRLVKLGHSVDYLGYGYTGKTVDFKDGYKIYPDTEPPTRKKSVLRFIEQTNPDIIFAHGPRDVFMEGIKAAKEKKIPYTAQTFFTYSDEKGFPNKEMVSRTIKPLDTPHLDHVFLLNRFSMGIFYSIGASDFSFLPNGADVNLFSPDKGNLRNRFGFKEDDIVILWVGTHGAGKDPQRAIRIFKYLREICSPEERNRLKLLMHCTPQSPSCGSTYNLKSMKVPEVYFTVEYDIERPEEFIENKYLKGKVSPKYTSTPQETMPLVYNSGDIYLNTSHIEGLSCIFLEAMACGLPVVASSHKVASEPVVPFVNGFLYESGQEAADRILTLMRHEDLRKRMSNNSRSHVALNYNWDYIVEELSDQLQKILHKYQKKHELIKPTTIDPARPLAQEHPPVLTRKLLMKEFEKWAVDHGNAEKNGLGHQYPLLVDKMNFITSLFKGRKHILDAGCGDGDQAILFARNAEKVIGIDCSPTNIKRAKQKRASANVSFEEGWIEDLTYPKESFDGIFLGNVLQYYDAAGKEQVLEKLASIRKQGGILVIDVPDKEHNPWQSAEDRQKNFDEFTFASFIIRYFRKAELLRFSKSKNWLLAVIKE